jgi:hypothetical protein
MGTDWKVNLANYFEELKILETSKQETLENFKQFCEFIAEPAFESLEEEIAPYKLRVKIGRIRKSSISFHFFFGRSRIENFQYLICLPKNSLELDLKLRIRGRRNKSSPFEESETKFMPDVAREGLLKMEKDVLVQDVIERYRSFTFEAFSTPD